MPKARKSPLAAYRRRMKRRGMVRVEVQVRKEDAALVRNVASALGDPDREAEARALLRQRFGVSRAQGLKELLSMAPLEGIEITRSSDMGRALDL